MNEWNKNRKMLGKFSSLTHKLAVDSWHLPGRASRFFDKISLHELHTRTGDVQPLAGTGIWFIEHGLQNPSPHALQ